MIDFVLFKMKTIAVNNKLKIALVGEFELLSKIVRNYVNY